MARLIGVLGGTFDPPHIGHRILADEGREALGLDQVYWVLTLFPPHKRSQPITPLDYRLEMLQEAIKGNSDFYLSSADIDRPQPHFSLGTMEWLSEHNPQASFIYLMGSDSFQSLPAWYQPREFLDSCAGFGVMLREGVQIDFEKLEGEIPGLEAKTRFFNAPMIGVSSFDIRRRVRVGEPYRYLVPTGVADIIEKYHLYQSAGD
jgi:nicotinate-nucleotide adenylyltransferase